MISVAKNLICENLRNLWLKRIDAMRSGHHHKRAGRRGGNALLLAIVVTMLLFILGMAFLSSTLTEKTTVFESEHDAALNNAIDEVIDKINDVLVQDLFGGDNNLLNGKGDSQGPGGKDESWDYPGPDDPWLASLEPEINDNGTPGVPADDWYSWRHITDLWGNNFDVRKDVKYYHPDNFNNSAQWDSDQPLISNRYLIDNSNYSMSVCIIPEDKEITDPDNSMIGEPGEYYTIRDAPSSSIPIWLQTG